MYEPGEATVCPDCDLALQRIEDLPPAKVVGGEMEPLAAPEDEVLPWAYAGRGRGALIALSIAGIVAFFLPWAHELMPERRTLSGVGIAAHLGWMWAPLVAWMVMIPLVLSRRTVFRMRGARVAAAFLSAMALLTVIVRVAFRPAGTALDPHRLEWGIGLWATGAIALVALAVSLRLGGRIDDLKTRRGRPSDVTLH
jgi:hypothetical protein